jgi:hypothetical protein
MGAFSPRKSSGPALRERQAGRARAKASHASFGSAVASVPRSSRGKTGRIAWACLPKGGPVCTRGVPTLDTRETATGRRPERRSRAAIGTGTLGRGGRMDLGAETHGRVRKRARWMLPT